MPKQSILEVVIRGKNQLSGPMAAAARDVRNFSISSEAMAASLNRAGLAAGVASTALVGLGLSTAKTARNLKSLSDRLGISVEELDELRFIAGQSNINFQQLAVAVQRSTRRVAEAAEGFGEAKGALKELRLDAEQLRAAGPAQAFEEILVALKGVESQSDRVRLAFKLFDSEGVSVLQVNNISKIKDEFSEIGALTTEFATQMERADQAWKRITTSFQNGPGANIAGNIANLLSFFMGDPGSSGVRIPFGASEDEAARILADYRAGLPATSGQAPAGASGRASLPARIRALAGQRYGLSGGGDFRMGPYTPAFNPFQLSGRNSTSDLGIPVAEFETVAEMSERSRDAWVAMGEQLRFSQERADAFNATLVDISFGFADNMGTAFASIVTRGESAAEALKRTFNQAFFEIAQSAFQNIFNRALGGIIGGLFGGGPSGAVVGATSGVSFFGQPLALANNRASAARQEVNVNVATTFGTRGDAEQVARAVAGAIKRMGVST